LKNPGIKIPELKNPRIKIPDSSSMLKIIIEESRNRDAILG